VGGGGFKKYEVSLPDFFDFFVLDFTTDDEGIFTPDDQPVFAEQNHHGSCSCCPKKPYSTIMGCICF
jgi:hypothetical protein